MKIAHVSGISILKAVVIIIAVGSFIYGNTLINEMFWDDYDGVVNNQYIRSWEYLPNYFSESLIAGANGVNNYWRPLVLLSFSIDFKIGGLEPIIYHLQNIFWHILASILILILARKLGLSVFVGLLAALFFLVHPLQTEAVAYVSGRADPMHLVFMLAGLIYFIKAVQKKFSKKYYLSAVLFFILALLTRERSIIFPLLVSLYLLTLWRKGKPFDLWRKKIVYVLPFFVMGVTYVILRMTCLQFNDNFDEIGVNNVNSLSWYGSILFFIKAWAVYAGLILWPVDLHMTRLVDIPKTFFDYWVVAGVILLGSITVGSVRLFKKEKIFIFGIGWICIGLVPTLYTSRMQGSLAEHWLYPVLPGLFLISAFYLERLIYWLKSKQFTYGILATIFVILIVFSITTIKRNIDWKNPIDFYEKNISVGGRSDIIYTNLGMAYSSVERYDEALEMYELAIAQHKGMFQPWYNMGNIYRIQGQHEKALDAYKKAIALNDVFLPIYKNSAIVYMNQGKNDEAINIMNKFIKRFPNSAEALYNIAIIYYKNGDDEKAREYMKKVLDIEPDNREVKALLSR
jgi:outer membrane protein assembly factor BamD (BamD/ComL family)